MLVSASHPINAVAAPGSARTMPRVDTESTMKDGPSEDVSQRLDFSRMTPRQLHAYIDDMIFKGEIDPDDACALFGSIPMQWYKERPDTPIDVAANIQGIADFNRNNGYPAVAVWYDGLSERMKLMEARSAPISVIA